MENRLHLPGWKVKYSSKAVSAHAAAASVTDGNGQEAAAADPPAAASPAVHSAFVMVIPSQDVTTANSIRSGRANENNLNGQEVQLVLDSGSGIHTCNDISLLTNVRRKDSPLLVRVANNEILKVKRVGDWVLGPFKRPTGGNCFVTLKDVAYSKQFSLNLVSVSLLFDRGHQLVQSKEKASVLLSNTKDEMIFQRQANGSVWMLSYQRPSKGPSVDVAMADAVVDQEIEESSEEESLSDIEEVPGPEEDEKSSSDEVERPEEKSDAPIEF